MPDCAFASEPNSADSDEDDPPPQATRTHRVEAASKVEIFMFQAFDGVALQIGRVRAPYVPANSVLVVDNAGDLRFVFEDVE